MFRWIDIDLMNGVDSKAGRGMRAENRVPLFLIPRESIMRGTESALVRE
jgi:hypothetical protein